MSMVSKSVLEVIRKEVSYLPDPRVVGRCYHSLFDIIVMTLCGVVAGGCEGWSDISLHAQDREAWFKQFLILENGIPHNDTFRRLYERLCPIAFQRLLIAVASSLREAFAGAIISIDVKALRHSFDNTIGQKHVHLVSAYDGASGVTLAQVATATKSNEITAIPKLLELVDISGATVTLNAMGCHGVSNRNSERHC
jgi:hypothetical protein